MTGKTIPWSALDHPETPAEQVAYLDAAIEAGDPGLVAAVLGDIAHARGLAQFAQESGIDPRTIELTFRHDGNPSLESITRVARVLGLRLKLVAA